MARLESKMKGVCASVRQEGVLVPHVVRCCVEEVERRGMDEVGIYRVSGAASDLGNLKAAFNGSKETRVVQKCFLNCMKQTESGGPNACDFPCVSRLGSYRLCSFDKIFLSLLPFLPGTIL